MDGLPSWQSNYVIAQNIGYSSDMANLRPNSSHTPPPPPRKNYKSYLTRGRRRRLIRVLQGQGHRQGRILRLLRLPLKVRDPLKGGLAGLADAGLLGLLPLRLEAG